MLLVVAALIVAFVLLLYMISPLISPKPLKLNGAHVVVSKPPVLTDGYVDKLCLNVNHIISNFIFWFVLLLVFLYFC